MNSINTPNDQVGTSSHMSAQPAQQRLDTIVGADAYTPPPSSAVTIKSMASPVSTVAPLRFQPEAACVAVNSFPLQGGDSLATSGAASPLLSTRSSARQDDFAACRPSLAAHYASDAAADAAALTLQDIVDSIIFTTEDPPQHTAQSQPVACDLAQDRSEQPSENMRKATSPAQQVSKGAPSRTTAGASTAGLVDASAALQARVAESSTIPGNDSSADASCASHSASPILGCARDTDADSVASLTSMLTGDGTPGLLSPHLPGLGHTAPQHGESGGSQGSYHVGDFTFSQHHSADHQDGA